jgi:hypothetical protein
MRPDEWWNQDAEQWTEATEIVRAFRQGIEDARSELPESDKRRTHHR